MQRWAGLRRGRAEPPTPAEKQEGEGDEQLLARRRLLQAALGGGAAAVASQAVIAPALAAGTGRQRAVEPPEWANVEAFQGVVRAVRGDVVTVDTGAAGRPDLRDVTFTHDSQVWYRGAVGGHLPTTGDVLVVRSVVPGRVQCAVINRVSFDAGILSRAGSDLEVAMSHPGSPGRQNLEVTVSDRATWYDSVTGVSGPSRDRLASAHIIGFRAGSSVVATELWYATERDAEFLTAHPPKPLASKTLHVSTPAGSFCVKSWSGSASEFDCPNGQGACLTCSGSSSSQAAWPDVINHCNYDNGCTGQCELKCGDSFLFFKCQQGSGALLTVVDNGPCQRSSSSCPCSPTVCGSGCIGDPCGLGGPKPRVVDLTAPTCARFFGTGECGACTVGVYCPCTNCTCPYG